MSRQSEPVHEYAEAWLIDADNVASQSRDGQQGVFTPDYGAPEILRGESGINTLTDSWSFAVMAYRVLTLIHPLKGDVVLEGARPLCTVELAKDGLWIEPSVGTQVSLQRASDDKVVAVVRRQRLKSDSRSGVSFWLHLGAVEEEHVVWRFNW